MNAASSLARALVLLCALAATGTTTAAESEVAPNTERMAWWRDARFGMFIHWGPVSLKGTEIGWSRGAQIPIEEYDNLYREFNPSEFNADEWVRIARDAGMKYVVFTTKHHDGFCMFDTEQTDFNIMHSPFARDVVKELSEACRRQGLEFGTYHSVCDWHHPDFPRGSPGGKTLKPNPNLDRYEQYLRAQVEELIRKYGPLLIMWFDVPQEFDARRGQGVVDFTRSLQPNIIVNNRCAVPADYDTPEQRVGGFNRQRPWETCMTIANQWAWKPGDPTKTLTQCLQTLLRTVGGDGNLLFNVGPMPDGRIEPEQVARLREMGDWLKKYGEAVYGTRGGPFKPGPWGASTCRDNQIYLAVMKWPADGPLVLPPIPQRIVGQSLLTGGSLELSQTEAGVALTVAAQDRQEIATVIRLTVDGVAYDIPPVAVAAGDVLSCQKPALASNVFQGQVDHYGPAMALDDDPGTRWATDAGTHSAWIEVDLGRAEQISRVVIDEAFEGRVRRFELRYKVGDRWQTIFAGEQIGRDFTRTFPPIEARHVRLEILEATEGPTIWEFQLFRAASAERENN